MTPLRTKRGRRGLLRCATVARLACAGLIAGEARTAERVFDLHIVRRKIVGAPGTIRVTVRDWIELCWTTDEATTIHAHGYDIELPLDPAAERRMRFEASATGRYPISAHGFGADTGNGSRREVVLLYLEVHPE